MKGKGKEPVARKGFFQHLDVSGIIVSYGVFLIIGGAWGTVTTGAMHSLYGGVVFGLLALFCSFLASFGDKTCVAAGVHIDLILASVLCIVFAIQTYKSFPAKMDRFPLFVILFLGSACHVGAIVAKKPRKQQKE